MGGSLLAISVVQAKYVYSPIGRREQAPSHISAVQWHRGYFNNGRLVVDLISDSATVEFTS